MGKTLEKAVQVAVADIVRHGDKLILPEKMKIPEAIDLLERRLKFEQEEVAVQETFLAFPLDGAYAMDKVLTSKFGWTPAEATYSFFGKNPPQMISVDIGPNQTVQVPWGKFSLPGVDGYIQSSSAQKDGRICFHLTGVVKRMYEETVREFFAEIRQFLRENSIYRGKAIKIRFRDDDGDILQMPEPKFLDTSKIKPENLIYSQDVHNSVVTNLFTPIERVRDLIANGIDVKRGILLGGKYGCGKTLAAHVASKLAVDNGLTFIYVTRADELADAINFAKLYNDPATVLFCEDIDRALQGQRTVKIDDILNILDGVDSKQLRLITVLTTNHLENINAAMLRPGRLDSIIEVTPPDEDAAERLLRFYGGEAINPEEDLSAAAKKLAGTIPATIAEVVKRAKLAQLGLQERGTKVVNLTAEALDRAAFTMKTQNELLDAASRPPAAAPSLDQALADVVEGVVSGGRTRVKGAITFGGSEGEVDAKVTRSSVN
jgi:transitional endoplasmic reticulum ATPase